MARHEAYKWFIDNLVDVAHHSRACKKMRTEGRLDDHQEKERDVSPRDLQMTALLAKLEPGERTLLAELMTETRCRAVHDVAGFLEWASTEARLSIVLDSEAIPQSPYDSMHRDFIYRYDGKSWPDTNKDQLQ